MGSRSRNSVTYTISEFYCCNCGTRGIPIPRKASKQRERGHHKKLYCLKCKAETNHSETRSFDPYKTNIINFKGATLNG